MALPWFRKKKYQRKRRPRWRPPPLTEAQILQWADAFHARARRWPRVTDGRIAGSLGEKWRNVDQCLRHGHRGLPGGSSLARLLARHRGKRNPADLPPFTERDILTWADAFHQRTGCWPHRNSGAIPEAPGETWRRVNSALKAGLRGLRGGSSLAWLLAKKRKARNRRNLPPLTEQRVLTWADAHHRRTGRWPGQYSGPVVDAPGETWHGMESLLRKGGRGLPGGSSLARLLADERGARNAQAPPPLTIPQILAWTDAHRRRTGQWPRVVSGPVHEAPGETWLAVDSALRSGARTLVGGSSLARLLADRRGVANRMGRPPLTVAQILQWADAHKARTGQWPRTTSGPIAGAPGETWRAVEKAFSVGRRSLPGGSSLARLLANRRGVRNEKALAPLTVGQILRWARAHRRRTGKWPTRGSGPVAEADGESWQAVDVGLKKGRRGLPGGSSLSQLLQRRGK